MKNSSFFFFLPNLHLLSQLFCSCSSDCVRPPSCRASVIPGTQHFTATQQNDLLTISASRFPSGFRVTYRAAIPDPKSAPCSRANKHGRARILNCAHPAEAYGGRSKRDERMKSRARGSRESYESGAKKKERKKTENIHL